MPKLHTPSPAEIILSRVTLAGYEPPELMRKAGNEEVHVLPEAEPERLDA